METLDGRKKSSLWRGWALPILVLAGVSAAVGFGVSRAQDVSFVLASGATFVAVVGVLGALMGVFKVYELAAGRLGWRCEIRPQAPPKSANHEVDIVITGEFEGRPFTLYRELTRDANRKVTMQSGLEWAAGEAHLPAFSLWVSRAFDVAADRVIGAGAMVRSIAGKLRARNEVPRAEFANPSKLARRSELHAPDAAAAQAVFSPTVCDALDLLVSHGSIESRDGMLVVHSIGFPMPWKLEEFVRHGEEIRRVVTG